MNGRRRHWTLPLALETADIGILRPDVSLVPTLIRLGRVTKRRIRENLLVFAVLYNGLAIGIAGLGVLSPIMAAIAHNIGSVAGVMNSARLIRWGRGLGVRGPEQPDCDGGGTCSCGPASIK